VDVALFVYKYTKLMTEKGTLYLHTPKTPLYPPLIMRITLMIDTNNDDDDNDENNKSMDNDGNFYFLVKSFWVKNSGYTMKRYNVGTTITYLCSMNNNKTPIFFSSGELQVWIRFAKEILQIIIA
jgi:hypothetical protein